MDFRLKQFAEEKRDRAKEIILERRKAMRNEIPVAFTEIGTTWQTLFGLELAFEEAMQIGDSLAVEQIRPELERAQIAKDEAETNIRAYRTRLAEIATKYALRLQALRSE